MKNLSIRNAISTLLLLGGVALCAQQQGRSEDLHLVGGIELYIGPSMISRGDFHGLSNTFTSDDGFSWKDLEILFPGVNVPSLQSKYLVFDSNTAYFYVEDSTIDPQVWKQVGGLWKTQDQGANWTRVLSDEFLIEKLFINESGKVAVCGARLADARDHQSNAIFGTLIDGTVKILDLNVAKGASDSISEVLDVSSLADEGLILLADVDSPQPDGTHISKRILLQSKWSIDPLGISQKMVQLVGDNANASNIEFLDQLHGLIFALGSSGFGGILYTANGGKTWTPLIAETNLSYACFWKNANEVMVADGSAIVAASGPGVFLLKIAERTVSIPTRSEAGDYWQEPSLGQMPVRSQRGINAVSMLARHFYLTLPEDAQAALRSSKATAKRFGLKTSSVRKPSKKRGRVSFAKS